MGTPVSSRTIIYNAPFCKRSVHICAHFCYKMVHCVVIVQHIVGLVRWVYFRLPFITEMFLMFLCTQF